MMAGRLRRAASLGALQELVAFVVRWSGICLVIRHTVARRRVSILLYHDPEPAVFERHLEYLSRRYALVPLAALVSALDSGQWETLPPRALVITFDDGHKRNFELLPLVRRFGVAPTVYVCSQIVGTDRHYWFLDVEQPAALKGLPNGERLSRLEREIGFTPTTEYSGERQGLSRDEIEAMVGAVDIQSHSRLHPVLTTCTAEECEDEIALARLEVEELTGSPCRHFSYPNGDYTSREIDILRRSGYASARTTDLGWNGPKTDPFRLKILGLFRDDVTVNRLAADLSGATTFLSGLLSMRPTGRHRTILPETPAR